MIFKKYRIGKFGLLIVRYKRTHLISIDTTEADYRCKFCGLGKETCKNLKIYTVNNNNILSNITFYSICYNLVLPSANVNNNREYIYIPWRVRL